MPTLRLTKRSIEALPHPPQGQVLYRDEMLRGFGVRVGSKSKVYFAEGQVNNRTRRATIDLYLKDWRRKPITNITRQMVLKRHQSSAKTNGEVTVNNVMWHLRSVFNVTGSVAFGAAPSARLGRLSFECDRAFPA